jgi:PAS domain S-box-containing protein
MNIGRKFALWIVSILLALGAVTGYVFYTIELREETAKLDLFGRMAGRIIEESLITFMQRRDNPGLNNKLDDVKKNAENIGGILLLNRDGVVKAATDKELIDKKFGIHDAGCRECHEKGSKRPLVSEGNVYRWASPIENKPACHACHLPSVKNNGVLIIDFSVAEFKQHVREELFEGFILFGSSIVLMGITMVILSRALVTRRLVRMGAAMKDFQQGVQSAFAPVEGHDEITQLESGFNEMAGAIQRREHEKEDLVQQLSASNEKLLKEIGLRTRWEAMLREQKNFTDNLIANSAVATFVIDADHKIVLWNKACEELSGFRAEDTIGTSDQWKPFYPHKRQTLSDVVIDGNVDSLSALYDRHARSALTPDGLQAEGWYKGLNGRDRYIIFDAAPLYDTGGKLIAVIETLQDITLRKQGERMLQEQLQFLQRLIDTIPMPVFYKDVNGVYLGYNRAFEVFLGMPREKLIGKTVYDVAPKELADQYYRKDKELFDRPGIQTYEFSVRHADGTIHDVIFNKATYTDAQGEIAGLIGAMLDITDRKRMEGAIRQTNETLQAVIHASPLAVISFDTNGNVGMWNTAAERIFGWSQEEVLGRYNPLVSEENKNEFIELLRRVLGGDSLVGLELKRRRKDGVLIDVSVSSAPLRSAKNDIVGMLSVIGDITERKRLEQKLAQSEGRLRAIIDTEPECVKLIARDGSLLEMNPAGLAMIEADSLEQVVGQRMSSLILPEYQAAFEALSEKTFREESGMLEFEIVGIKGTRRWLETHTAPLRNAQGEIFALLGVTRDITERKRAEQVIRRNYDTQTAINWILHISLEDMPLVSVLKQTLDLILSIPWLAFEAKGSIFLVEGDPRTLVMKAQRGLSEDLKNVCDVVPFGTCLCGRAAARGETQFADKLDERHEIRYEGITPHGHYCVPILQGKTVLGVINMYIREGHRRDDKEIEFLNAIANALAGIIQRKRIEDEREKLIVDLRSVLNTVSRSHKEWQDTFDSITDMISIVDRDFTILKANIAFSVYYGLQPQDVVGRKCYDLIHDGESPVPNCPHSITMNEQRMSPEEFYDKKTRKMFLIATFPYNSPEGEAIGSIHIMRDITGEKEKEMRLIMSERLAALGQMASGIAHEINNPLASIAGCSEGLLSRLKKGQFEAPLFQTYLNIIQEEVFRCKSITTAMLSFVRKTTYEKKDLNLPEALDKTIEIIGFQGRLKNVEVIKKYQASSLIIRGNEGELRQVWLVIISNAIDAMHEKGSLTVEIDAVDNNAIIRISDNGEGISPENIASIFDPFFTTKSERGGTGIGLSIARKIVSNHNGRVEASSSPGQGTTFTITLPL